MILYFFKSLFRFHSALLLRIFIVLFLSSFGFITTQSFLGFAQNKILIESRQILGGDIVLEGESPLTLEQKDIIYQAKDKFDFEFSSAIEFQSNIKLPQKEAPVLTDVKIVDTAYLEKRGISLSGEGILISDNLGNIGDDINFGNQVYKVIAFIPQQSSVAFSLFTQGREVWIPDTLIPDTTDILGLGSRVEYEYFIETTPRDIQTLTSYLEAKQTELGDFRIRDIYSTQDRVTSILFELQKFLQVFLISICILTFLSIFFTLETFRRQEQRYIGLFSLLGYQKYKTILLLGGSIVCLYIISFIFAVGGVLGIFSLLKDISLFSGISIDIRSLFESFIFTSFIMIFASSYTLFKLSYTPVLQLIKSQEPAHSRTQTLFIAVLLIALIFLFSLVFLKNIFLAFLTSIIAIAIIIVFSLFLKLFLSFFFQIVSQTKQKYFSLYYTSRALLRPRNMSILISFPVTLIIIIFFFFSVFSFALLDITRSPSGESKYFVLNVSQQETQVLEELFPTIQLYDSILARIISINKIPLKEFLGNTNRDGEFTREFNITTHPLPNNIFTQGLALSTQGVSLDEEFANRLGVKIGDEVVFLLSGREVAFQVQNTRPALRDSLSPFFYFQIFESDVAGLGRNYFGTLGDEGKTDTQIQKELFDISPRLQFINISDTLEQVEKILGGVFDTVLFLFLYMSILIAILLSVSLRVLKDIRSSETRILRILGASQKFTNNFLTFEYSILLFFSTLVGSVFGLLGSVWFLLSSSFLSFQFAYLLSAFGTILFLVSCMFLFLMPKGENIFRKKIK